MAGLARSVATLRIVGDTLVPAEVSALLGCEPTRSHALGDVLSSRRIPARTADFGLWSLEAAEAAPADLDAQIAWILGRLPDDLRPWQRLGEQFHVSLFCGWFMHRWNEGVTITPASLRALGDRGIHLDIDLYGRDADVSVAGSAVEAIAELAAGPVRNHG